MSLLIPKIIQAAKPHITTTHLTVRLKANIAHHQTAVLLITLLPIQTVIRRKDICKRSDKDYYNRHR